MISNRLKIYVFVRRIVKQILDVVISRHSFLIGVTLPIKISKISSIFVKIYNYVLRYGLIIFTFFVVLVLSFLFPSVGQRRFVPSLS